MARLRQEFQRGRRWHRRRWLVEVGALVGGWLLLELLMGWVFSAEFFGSGFEHGRRLVEQYRYGATERPAPVTAHPYLLYTRTPGFAGQYNTLGYRTREISVAKPPHVLRILCLGGSTTDMYPYIAARDSTWPMRLERRLIEELKVPVEVVNAGLPAGTSAEILSAYVHRHRYLKPDWVIFHEGGNDVIPVLYPGYSPEYTHYRAAGVGLQPRPLERALLRSNVLKVAYAVWLNSTPAVVRQQPAALSSISADSALVRVRRVAPVGFSRNVDVLFRLLKADSVRVLAVPFAQASAAKIDATPGFEGKGAALTEGLVATKAVLKSLTARYGFYHFEIPDSLLTDTHFQDNCHPTEAGEALKAEAISWGLIEAIKRSEASQARGAIRR